MLSSWVWQMDMVVLTSRSLSSAGCLTSSKQYCLFRRRLHQPSYVLQFPPPLRRLTASGLRSSQRRGPALQGLV